MMPYTTFTCPRCGAPGEVINGLATYTCICRYQVTECTRCHCQERAQKFAGDPRDAFTVSTTSNTGEGR